MLFAGLWSGAQCGTAVPDFATSLGKNIASASKADAEPDCPRILSDFGRKPGHEGSGAADGGRHKAHSKQNRPRGSALGEVFHKPLEAEDAQHPREVVAERHEAPLPAHLVKAADQEVAVTGAALEGAERMLGQAGTLA